MSPTNVRWLHAAIVVTAAVILQVTIFDRYHPFGVVRIDLPLILVVCIGFVATPSDAAVLGFVTGIFLDTMQFGPFGLSALVYCLAGWLIVLARLRILQAGPSFRTAQGASIVVLVTAATWLAGSIFGLRPAEFDLAALIRLASAGVVGALLVHPVTVVASWMIDELDRPPRVVPT